jgi:hypothetical protein
MSIILPPNQFNRRIRSLRQSLTINFIKKYKFYVYKIYTIRFIFKKWFPMTTFVTYIPYFNGQNIMVKLFLKLRVHMLNQSEGSRASTLLIDYMYVGYPFCNDLVVYMMLAVFDWFIYFLAS